MRDLPKKLLLKLKERQDNNALRRLGIAKNLIDFSSNDYLGFANSEDIFNATQDYLMHYKMYQNGATGSRLLTGNHKLYDILETFLSTFHHSDAALVFNSGYDANVGFFSSIPQRNDVILYDELSHASIRDGISLSHAKAYKFKHNNLKDLEDAMKRVQQERTIVYVVTESVFSMDGDSPNLKNMVNLCNAYNAKLIVDEAHAVGVFGVTGFGLVQSLNLQYNVFARLITFGKALGNHGAAILGSQELKDYLINFARSFIYTTGLPPHSLATTLSSYKHLVEIHNDEHLALKQLHKNIQFFNSEIRVNRLQDYFIQSDSAIHCCILSGNNRTKKVAALLNENGFDVKPILSPTVTEGQERLRFCIHSYNSKKEITKVLELLATFVKHE